jgi:hypothetical protein
MTYIENLLSTVFSSDVGLSDSAISRALADIIANPDKRELYGLRDELKKMLNSEQTDWINLLDNDKFEVVMTESQEEARQFIVDNVWQPLFAENWN